MEATMERPLRRERPRGRARALVPREHGAYGQVAFPLVVAHLTAAPTLAGWLFTLGAVVAFVAHEPWLVVLGRRGPRATRELGPLARRWLLFGGLATLLAVGLGLFLAPPLARLGALLPAALAPLVALFVWRDEERTLVGELVVGAALPALAVPVALAGGVEPHRALATWTVWTLGTAAATGSVRAVIAQLRAPSSAARRALVPFVVLALAGVGASVGVLDAKAVVALVPLLEVAAVAALLAPHPRHLRQVGWTLVAATVITAGLLCL